MSCARRSRRSRRACSRSARRRRSGGDRRLAEQLDVLFSRLAANADDAEFRFAVHTAPRRSSICRSPSTRESPLLKLMIERQHVLILNWLFDLSGRRTPLPPGFHARLADALTSATSSAPTPRCARTCAMG